MIQQELYQIEIAGRLATMYVTGNVSKLDTRTLLAACDTLPASVQTIRISLDDLSQLGDAAPTIIHDLRRHWQATRKGGFRVSFGWTRSGERLSVDVALSGASV